MTNLLHSMNAFSVANVSFYQVTLNTLGILPTCNNSLSRSRLQCSALCLTHFKSCQNVLYNNVKKLCLGGADLGSAGIKPSTSQRLYSQSTKYCDVSLGYNSTIMRTYGLCLSISKPALTFSAANLSCRSRHGRLVITKTNATYDSLLRIMQDMSIDWVWVGLDDGQTEGTYVWSDGTVATKSEMLFLAGQPDNLYNSDCIALSRIYLGLDDVSCSGSKIYICEYVT
uniref:C-type lectin domain-containing protein n=1 Tax=Biomphalaria glabrata TaxID=6526 RepID=A0A2C9LD87_BIOGL